MTVVDLPVEPSLRIDPFQLPSDAPASRRPRPLSYLGRWGRARRWLPDDARHVLDVGCASGYGSAAIGGGGRAGRIVVGVERDPQHLDAARQRFPWVTIINADATDLPVEDGCSDAVIMLDIIEHLPDPERAIAEAYRALRAGGTLIISVPHRGALRWLDALNLYAAVRRRRPSLPPLEAATESGGHDHHHYVLAELEALLAPSFTVDRRARTGLGLQELVTLAIIVLGVGLRASPVARLLLPLHLAVYVLDDLLPTGPLAYHLTVRARAHQAVASDVPQASWGTKVEAMP